MMQRANRCWLGFTLLAIGNLCAWADVLPVATVAASSTGTDNFDRAARRMVDGSGVNPVGAGPLTHANNPTDTMWLSAAGGLTNAWARFDLGEICNLNSLTLYNYNDHGTQLDLTTIGLQGFTVWTSNSGAAGSFTQYGGVFTADEAPGTETGDCTTTINLPGAAGRFVELRAQSNYGHPDAIGLSEAVFDGTKTGRGRNIIPVSAIAESSLSSDTLADNLINGNGLDSYGEHSSTIDDSLRHHWRSGSSALADGVEHVTFDLGELQDLAAVRIWNMNAWFLLASGAKTIDLLVSPDGTAGSYAPAGTITLGQAGGHWNRDFSEIFALNAQDVRYVQFAIHGNQQGSSGIVALSEVQFLAVPEPAAITVPLLALLFGIGRRSRA